MMYQCTFFYQHPDEAIAFPFVLSAWDVLTDQFYDYQHEDEKDATFYPAGTYAFVRTVEGSGIVTTEDGDILLCGGEAAVIREDTISRLASNRELWKYNWVNFLWKPGSPLPEQFPGKIQQVYSYREKELFEELLAAGNDKNALPDYVNSIFAHYFYYMIQNNGADEQRQRVLPVEEVRAYIDQKYYARLKVADVAKFFNISPRRLNQIFHKEHQMSPKQYIQQLKIEKAKALLAQTSSHISEIADMLSFDSTYHFSSSFKKGTGMTPTQYRKLHYREMQETVREEKDV